MTTNIQPTQSREQTPRRKFAQARSALAFVQLALVGGVVIAGVRALHSTLHPAPDAAPACQTNSTMDLSPMPVALPAVGTWTLDNMPLSLGIEILSADQLADRMAIPPQTAARGDEGAEPTDGSFLALVRSSHLARQTRGDYTIYSLDQPRMKLRLFATGAGPRERLVGGYLAYPRDPQTWTLVAGTLSAAGKPAPTRPHLLPLTASARVIGVRTGRDGRVQCEVVETRGNLEELCRRWKDAGWSILGNPAAAGEGSFRCVKGDAEVCLHLRRNAAGHSILLLIDVHQLAVESQTPCEERASS